MHQEQTEKYSDKGYKEIYFKKNKFKNYYNFSDSNHNYSGWNNKYFTYIWKYRSWNFKITNTTSWLWYKIDSKALWTKVYKKSEIRVALYL